MEKKNDKKPQGCSPAFLIFLGIVAVIVIGWTYLSSNSGSDPDKLEAFTICQNFVEDRLKAPSTADFSSLSESAVSDLSDGRFSVAAYVDAQNSFGAKLRTKYLCVVKSKNGDNWQLEKLDFIKF